MNRVLPENLRVYPRRLFGDRHRLACLCSRGFYRKQLGFLLSDQPNCAAISFYLLFVALGCSCSPLFPVCRPALYAGPCFWGFFSA